MQVVDIVFWVAVYYIIWFLTLFTVLPFGVRTQGEAQEVVPGTPSSAPANMKLLRVLAINSVVALVVFAIIFFLIMNNIVSSDMFYVPDHSQL